MNGHYGYQQELCNCPESLPAPGNAGIYDYMDDICVCGQGTVLLGMRDLEGNETTMYPVNVYNINEVFIGYATTKSQYRIIWNNDPANHIIGTLDNGPGPFQFSLTLNQGQSSPGFVIGDPDEAAVIIDGIYGIQYGIEYE